MLIFQIIMMAVGIIGSWYCTKKVIKYGKTSGMGQAGTLILWLFGLVLCVIEFVTFGVFAFIV